MRLASRAAVELPMKPTRGIFPPCCARAANGHAATTPPSIATNFRRLMEASPPVLTPRELRLSHSGATPVVHHSKIVGQCLRWVIRDRVEPAARPTTSGDTATGHFGLMGAA